MGGGRPAYCRNCGKQLSPSDDGCPRCGSGSSVPRAASPPPSRFVVPPMPLPSAPDTGWTFPFILFGCTVASAVLAVVVVYAATGRCESGFFGVTECGLEAVGTRLIFAGIPLFSALTAVIVIAGFIGILPRRRMLALRAQQAILVAALGVVALWFAVNIAGG